MKKKPNDYVANPIFVVEKNKFTIELVRLRFVYDDSGFQGFPHNREQCDFSPFRGC